MSARRSAWAVGGLATLVAVVLAVVLLAGGGGSSSSASSSSSEAAAGRGSSSRTAAAEGSRHPQRSDYIVESDDSVTKGEEGATEFEEAEFPQGRDTDEVSSSGAKPIRPCALVNQAEANEILGGDVHVVERPLGPTCVVTGSGRVVTLAVSNASLSSLVEEAREAHELTISGHQAWCLQYQDSSVAMQVGSRVLQITGACQAGARFAAAALPTVSG